MNANNRIAAVSQRRYWSRDCRGDGERRLERVLDRKSQVSLTLSLERIRASLAEFVDAGLLAAGDAAAAQARVVATTDMLTPRLPNSFRGGPGEHGAQA